jgi:large subunit ribosomal protein L24
MASRIRKGDKVAVLSGRDKGKQGEVIKVLRAADRVIVRGINIVKRHTRQSAKSSGGIVEQEAAIHVSNVAHLDPKDNKPTRVGFRLIDGTRKVRYAKRSGEIIDR